jgi:hypothetical protein
VYALLLPDAHVRELTAVTAAESLKGMLQLAPELVQELFRNLAWDKKPSKKVFSSETGAE